MGDCSDLSGLKNIKAIQGNLQISQAAILTNISLRGLSNLTSVGGHLSIINTRHPVSSLAGLSLLSHVGGNLRVEDNADLDSLDGLSSLISVGGFFIIQNNGKLTSLSGLSSLITVGDLLTIRNNGYLSSLGGLSSLKSVGGPLRISDNDASLDVGSPTGLFNLTSVEGHGISLHTIHFGHLETCTLASDGPIITYVTGNVVIRRCTVGDFSNLTGVGGDLIIDSNEITDSLNGLSSIMSVGGDIEIEDNLNSAVPGRSTSLSGFTGSVRSVGGSISIRNNIVSGISFRSLLRVGGDSIVVCQNSRGLRVSTPVSLDLYAPRVCVRNEGPTACTACN